MLPGIVPSTTIQMDSFWKEMDGDSDWVGVSSIVLLVTTQMLIRTLDA